MRFFPSLALLAVPGSPKHFLYPRRRRSHLYPGVSAAWGTTLGKQKPLCVLMAADSSRLEGLRVDELGFTLLHVRCGFLLLWHFNYTRLFLHEEKWTSFSLYPPIMISFQISAWVSVWAATRWREPCAGSLQMTLQELVGLLWEKKNLYSVICNKVHLFGFVFNYAYLMFEYVKYMPSSEF